MEMITLIIVFLSGSMIGALLLRLALYLISRREGLQEKPRNDVIYSMTGIPGDSENTKSPDQNTKSYFKSIPVIFTENRLFLGIVMLLNGTGWLFSVMASGYSLRTAQFILFLSAAMVISIIDINARIIPNTLILFLLFSSVLFCLVGTGEKPFLLHLLGLVVTGILFCIPLLLTKTVGSGDIKYLAVMGFCLGYPDAIKAIMVFSAILLGWFIFLFITKKGGLRTKLALGPFISLGFVATLLF